MPVYERVFRENMVVLSDPTPGRDWSIEVFATVQAQWETIAVARGGEKPAEIAWTVYFEASDSFAMSLLEIQKRAGHVAVSWDGAQYGRVTFHTVDVGVRNQREMSGTFDLDPGDIKIGWKLIRG